MSIVLRWPSCVRNDSLPIQKHPKSLLHHHRHDYVHDDGRHYPYPLVRLGDGDVVVVVVTKDMSLFEKISSFQKNFVFFRFSFFRKNISSGVLEAMAPQLVLVFY